METAVAVTVTKTVLARKCWMRPPSQTVRKLSNTGGQGNAQNPSRIIDGLSRNAVVKAPYIGIKKTVQMTITNSSFRTLFVLINVRILHDRTKIEDDNHEDDRKQH